MLKHTFPEDLLSQSPMVIRFRIYDKVTTPESSPDIMILLPAPLALSNQYSVSFDDLEAGLLEKTFEEFSEGVNNVMNTNSAGEATVAALGSFADGVVNTVGNVIGGAGIVRRALGSNINKKNEMVINKPNNRSFNLRFQLVPKKKEESKTIQDIIQAFKLAMHPPTNKALGQQNGSNGSPAEDSGAGGIFFLNPARVKVDFLFNNDIQQGNGSLSDANKTNKLFSTSFCFIQSLDVNYHNAGAPSYFGDGQPGNMSFNIQMQEIRPNSREMISRIDYDSRGDNNNEIQGLSLVGSAFENQPEIQETLRDAGLLPEGSN